MRSKWGIDDTAFALFIIFNVLMVSAFSYMLYDIYDGKRDANNDFCNNDVDMYRYTEDFKIFGSCAYNDQVNYLLDSEETLGYNTTIWDHTKETKENFTLCYNQTN